MRDYGFRIELAPFENCKFEEAELKRIRNCIAKEVWRCLKKEGFDVDGIDERIGFPAMTVYLYGHEGH